MNNERIQRRFDIQDRQKIQIPETHMENWRKHKNFTFAILEMEFAPSCLVDGVG